MKNFIVQLLSSFIFLLAGFWVLIHVTFCAQKHRPTIIDPFENVHAICKESDDGGLCFCCHGEDKCYSGYYDEASSFWQMTCDQASQMNFRIILKGQKQ